MTVVRLASGGTAIYSAIALREPEMAQIEALGAPQFLVVPNGHHRLDAAIWKTRYPALRVVAPAGARDDVSEVLPVDATDDPFADADVQLIEVAGSEGTEFAMRITRGDATTLVTNDVIAHVVHPDGLGGQAMARLLGFGVHGPQVPRVAKHWIKDKHALAAQFREWAAIPNLRRIVVSHGSVIDEDPAGALRELAHALDT